MTSRCSPSVLSWCIAPVLYFQGGSKIEKVQIHPVIQETQVQPRYINLLIYKPLHMHISDTSIIYNRSSTQATLWVTAQKELQSKTLSQKTPRIPTTSSLAPTSNGPRTVKWHFREVLPLLRESMASCFPLLRGGRGKRIMCYFKHCILYSSREVSLLLFFQLTPNPVTNLFS